MPSLRRRALLGLVGAGLCGVSLRSFAQDKPPKPLEKVSLVLQWVTQCQFAGYSVALEKGYYRLEDIVSAVSQLECMIMSASPSLRKNYAISWGAGLRGAPFPLLPQEVLKIVKQLFRIEGFVTESWRRFLSGGIIILL